LLASEAVYGWEREIVSEVFNCRVFSNYGMAEQVVLAAECEYSHFYHCLPQYSITEIDPETNEIIGTSFLHYINPFIRYRTNDIAFKIKHSHNCCRREYYPIIEKVEGRLGDYIMTLQGLIGPSIIIHPFKDLKTIKDTQIVQKSVNYIVLRIVKWEDKEKSEFKSETNQLSYDLKKILGNDMRIEVEEVEEIERTKSGKFKWIVSEVARDSLEKGVTAL